MTSGQKNKGKPAILLVEPDFPIPPKSKNHKNFLPIGLLKLHDYYQSTGHRTRLIRGNKNKREIGSRFKPDRIMVTSLFTYWSRYVRDCVQHYRGCFPDAEIIVGGIYASLMPKHCRDYTRCDRVHRGVHNRAEAYAVRHNLNYKMLSNPDPIDYQIIHSSRGCIRKCRFCGTWRIEPRLRFKKSISNEIVSRKLVFYDNNLLANPNIEAILDELVRMKQKRKLLSCESQSGFDGRVLLHKPHLAVMLKQAGFIYPRIAWDWGYEKHKTVREQLQILNKGGYRTKYIFVFMIYNWNLTFNEMERKRRKCWTWGVQISDCRYRPLNQTFDEYKSFRKQQSNRDYFIHKKWTDAQIRMFRRNVRRQNICIRQDTEFYSRKLERKRIGKQATRNIKRLTFDEARRVLDDVWHPMSRTI